MSGAQKNDTTSLEMAVSVDIDPHQIFVSRACRTESVHQHWQTSRVCQFRLPQGGTRGLTKFLLCSLEPIFTEETYVALSQIDRQKKKNQNQNASPPVKPFH